MGAQAVRLSNVDIDNALKNKDFEVLFQPIFDLGNGALARVETFVRWRHPRLGLLPPGAFISFFESQGRMSELTRYVLGTALNAYMDWRGPWPPGLSVNLALSDLSDDAFTSHFTKLLRDYDFPADLVTLECPMPPVDMPVGVAASHFQRLSKTGARLAIEVRGRTNDLLRSLDPFPFDEIKTGGSAILRFARTVRGPGLSAIADLLDVASKSNAAITAVGVEDQASLSALRGLGFTAAQGNHLGKVGDLKEFRPQRINEVRELLGLDPLSQESLVALFRTEAPSVQTAETAEEEEDGGDTEDALLERLNERVAQFGDASEIEADSDEAETTETSEPVAQTETEDAGAEGPRAEEAEAAAAETPAQELETAAEDDKKARAREKAKALALAKRAKARAARKTAAIERAKAKAAAKPEEEDAAAGAPPREMQERLSEAFKTEDTPEKAAETASAAPAEKPAREEPQEQETQADAGTPFLINREEIAQNPVEVGAQAAGAQRTTIERAMAAQAHAHEEAAPSMSLPVGPSGAYFQPGIRVGAPALPGEPETPVTPSGLEVPELETGDDAPEEPPLAARPRSAPEVQAPQEDDTLGDLHAEDSATEETAKPVRRRKPFLKRTVIPISGYFWPRSWRRAWKRRAAEREARRAEREENDAQPQAAE
ncbi:EAL domain-containing protein [Hyphococcus luteus]|uniref:EAL domain-containing protein n=1 Tax=Hyphococcus luteus TaxID=2058213 RepID=A0A2S7K103_9PROT|nr:EAL domain-containing protein [Marinicaulis flavus]PQA86184.1 hypothetical protein CW354_17670 [Marinicaulis flavus]